jgi:radical SAM superfamily enzyme YgiQ (UPF0313 family)
MRVVLVSTYDLGHQPFGLASPAAWLRAAGCDVRCLDLAVEALDENAIRAADLVALYLPMHTATRLAAALLPQLRALNPYAHLCCYGLYAPLNEELLRELGVGSILGGEFEQGLVELVTRLHNDDPLSDLPPPISLARQQFVPPDRGGLPALARYAFLDVDGKRRVAGYTEASRGCKHTCRHCPIVPVYGGQFRIVGRDVVLADVRQQVAAGAQHITFGDPDFFNGPRHALEIVRALHAEFPDLSYDVTIKVEHLLRHAAHLSTLRDTGCVLITSAVEAVDDAILRQLDKRHTRADFVRAVALLRDVGIALNPTFVAFTPWITLAGYLRLLATIAELDLIPNVAPIQYAIRLLIPAGSRLLELPEVRRLVEPFDPSALVSPWAHPDPAVDRLQAEVLALVQQSQRLPRHEVFERVWKLAIAAQEGVAGGVSPARAAPPRPPIPYLSEPWYC